MPITTAVLKKRMEPIDRGRLSGVPGVGSVDTPAGFVRRRNAKV